MLSLIDTHAHLYSRQFDSDRSEMIGRARNAGVSTVLLPNIDRHTTEAMWQTVDSDPAMFRPMMGVHPCHVKDDFEEELAHVFDELSSGRYIAVGEIGIDLYWDKETLPMQQEAFARQLRWAKQFRLPVAIHCRDAFDEVFAGLEQEQDGTLMGVLHCFTGNAAQAERCISLGMHLGIGGVLTYKNSGVAEAIANVPMERLILETDSPYLAPVPHRGKRNESAYVLHVAERLAEVRGMGTGEIAAITTSNAQRLFRL